MVILGAATSADDCKPGPWAQLVKRRWRRARGCPGTLTVRRLAGPLGEAPALLSLGGGSYGVLFAVAGVSALLGAAEVLPVRFVRWRGMCRPSAVCR